MDVYIDMKQDVSKMHVFCTVTARNATFEELAEPHPGPASGTGSPVPAARPAAACRPGCECTRARPWR